MSFEAIQLPEERLDCFASLAMTAGRVVRRKKAGAIGTGLFNSMRRERDKLNATLLDATLTQRLSRKSLHHFRDDTADTAAGEADGVGGALA